MSNAFQHSDIDMLHRLRQLRVLIVDDQVEVRMVVRDILHDAGIRCVFEAPNVQAAMEIATSAHDKINFIVCDWNMPGMTGLEFLRNIREWHPRIPFLMLTGRGDLDSVISAKDSGVNGYLHKPFTPQDLEDKIMTMLARQRP